MKPPTCRNCLKEVNRQRDLRKVNELYLCKKCYVKNRARHREVTIEKAGISEELKELDRKYKREYNKKNTEKIKLYNRERYTKRVGYKPRKYNKEVLPLIKVIKKQKSNAYLSFEEKQNLFRILIKNGLNYSEADLRIKNLVRSQAELRDKLRVENKSQEEVKARQKQMVEELYQSVLPLNNKTNI